MYPVRVRVRVNPNPVVSLLTCTVNYLNSIRPVVL